MVLKVLQKFPPTLILVHGWLFPAPSLQTGLTESGKQKLLVLWWMPHLRTHVEGDTTLIKTNAYPSLSLSLSLTPTCDMGAN